MAVVFAGCVGIDGSGPAGPAEDNTNSDAVTGLVGRVVSDELFPVVEAHIIVAGEAAEATTDSEAPVETWTDEEGRFELLDLPPGPVTLSVSAEGYETLLHPTEVPTDGLAEIRILLTGIPGQSPYYTTVPYTGFEVCSFSIVYSAQPIPGGVCPLGDRAAATSVGVGEGWKAGVHEMVWETQDEMIFASSLADSCIAGATESDACPALIWGPSPLRVIARPLDAEYAAQYALDGTATWPEGAHTSHIFEGYAGLFRSQINQTGYPVCVIINNQFSVPEHWGCPFGIGVSVGIRFEFYHTTFYHQEPLDLESFTATPDT